MSDIASSQPSLATYMDYIRIARFDHVTKHVFVLPGIALAALLRPEHPPVAIYLLFIGFLATIAIASANYVINEWLDRPFDRFHPEKSKRPAVQRQMSPVIIYLEYLLLASLGLGLATLIGTTFFAVELAFLISGLIYNVKPFRSKDIVFLDVLSESINNPIRLTLGWVMIDSFSLPPSSLLLGFWIGGAFLMNSKRLAEYRDICAVGGRENLGLYRRSFRYYTEQRLLVASFLYAIMCSFFTAVFLIKYKIEYILMFPCLSLLFAEYFLLSLSPNSVARQPEQLFKARRLVALVGLCVITFAAATALDLPFLDQLTSQHFIELKRR